jgi:hypothetical protein
VCRRWTILISRAVFPERVVQLSLDGSPALQRTRCPRSLASKNKGTKKVTFSAFPFFSSSCLSFLLSLFIFSKTWPTRNISAICSALVTFQDCKPRLDIAFPLHPSCGRQNQTNQNRNPPNQPHFRVRSDAGSFLEVLQDQFEHRTCFELVVILKTK